MKLQVSPPAACETVTIDRANTGGLQQPTVAVGADGRFELLTDDPVDVPAPGTLPYGALTPDTPLPIRAGDPELAG